MESEDEKGIMSERAKEIRKDINRINYLKGGITKIVCHMVRTSDDKGPNGEPWIDYWKKNVELIFRNIHQCPQCKKETRDFVGAHVRSEDGKCYICPVCKECNVKYQSPNKEKAEKDTFTVQKGYLCPLPEESEFGQSN